MTNQRHAVVMGPQSQFQALQTQQAHLVVFSIGTDNVFYRTLETPGEQAGWNRLDESSALTELVEGRSVAAKLFDVAQNLFIGTIDVALAMTIGEADQLMLSLGNSNLDEAWATPFTWQPIPFDAPEPPAKLVITDIYLTQGTTARYIVVDILADPASPLKTIERYFIDPTKKLSGRYWNKHALAVSLEAGSVASRLGRKASQLVDGIYTLGTLTDTVELLYSQIYNPYNPVHGNPLVTRFTLPDGAESTETAFTLGANADGTTDLYVAVAGGLYYLAAQAQTDRAAPVEIARHTLLRGVSTLNVDVNGERIVVWGLNKFGKVFCLRGRVGSQLVPGAWSVPVPLLADALMTNTLINRLHGGSILFAHTDKDDLVQLSEDPVTTLWAKRSITLPPTAPRDMVTVTTYTTHVQLRSDDNLPLNSQTVGLTADRPCSVYVNNRYINLFVDTPIELKTDASGTLTIVQDVTSLGAVSYQLESNGDSIGINPMRKVTNKLATVKTGDDLNVEVTDSRGNKQPLVGPGISAEQKDNTAQMIQQFVGIADKLPSTGSRRGLGPRPTPRTFDANRGDRLFGLVFHNGSSSYFADEAGAVAARVLADRSLLAEGAPTPDGQALDNVIWALAGDIYKWATHALDEVEQFFVTVVDDIATGFIKIAGVLYRFLLDALASVVDGINFVLEKIKVFLDDLIKWLGFLFEWPDIVRTHRVLKNLFKQFARYSVDNLTTLKTDITNSFITIEQELGKWANLPVLTQSPSSIAGSTPVPAGSSDPQLHWGVQHLNNGATVSNTSYTQAVPEQSELERLLNEVLDAMQREETTFANAISQLQTQVVEQFKELTVTQVLQKIVVIVLDVLLETVENMLVTAIDIVQILVEGVIDFLDAPLDVPIISQIYATATEGDSLTILDALCLVVAIPTTILYKLAEGKAPYPDEKFTNDLIEAPDFAALRALFATPTLAAGRQEEQQQDSSAFTVLEKVCFYVAVPAAAVIMFTTPFRVEFGENLPLALVGTVAYVFYCAPNLPGIVTNDRSKWYNIVNSTITSISLVKAIGDIGLTRYKEGGTNAKCLTFWNKASPIVETVINFFWFTPVIGAIVDKQDESTIIQTVSNSAFNVAGMMAWPMTSKNPYVAVGALLGFIVGDTVYGYLDYLQGQMVQQAPARQGSEGPQRFIATVD